MGFDHAIETSMMTALGSLFAGGVLNAVVQVSSGNAAAVSGAVFFANPITLMLVSVGIAYGFFYGRKGDKAEEKAEAEAVK